MRTDGEDATPDTRASLPRRLGRLLHDLAEAMEETEVSLLSRRVERLERELETMKTKSVASRPSIDG